MKKGACGPFICCLLCLRGIQRRLRDGEGLDLVEIAPNADPPVCRIMDYRKYKYDQAIKAKQAR